MKICIFSDVHWSVDSSIIRSRGNKYSTRLEYLINSLNFVNYSAALNNCDYMICAGDFFNKAQVVDEETTALNEVQWNYLNCYFLCGNHESSVADLRFNTASILENSNHFIVANPYTINGDTFQIHFIPYVVESDRQNIEQYILDKDTTKKQIIISHNDIQGIKYGCIESKTGFSISEIESNCDLCINGHIHNSEWISEKILNIGSVSAHNFTNDSFKYDYGIWILDTDTLDIKFINNPYSFSFYKLNIQKDDDLNILDSLKSNCVLSVSCANAILAEKINTKLSSLNNIVEKRILITGNNSTVSNISGMDNKLESIDHLQKLVEFCKQNIDNTDILDFELSELTK